jgi:hypothetical protein
MAAKSTTYAGQLLAQILNGVGITGLTQNAASPLANLYLSLHTAAPGVGGAQTTNEAAYTGYARVAVTRSGTGWNITGAVAALAATATFPSPTGGAETETFFAVGTAASGTGLVLYAGALSSNIAVTAGGAAPGLASGSTTITES